MVVALFNAGVSPYAHDRTVKTPVGRNYALDEAAIRQLMLQNAVHFFSNHNKSRRAR